MRLGVEAALVDGKIVRGDVEIDSGSISGIGLSSPNGRGLAVPGFVDLQVNGFAGVDLSAADAEGYRRAGEAMLEAGVTAYLPTFITAPEDRLVAALRAMPVASAGPRILGAHLEGPFISPARLGIHPAARCDPDRELLGRLLAVGAARMMTLAPELPDADELIRVLRAHAVTVSCGHSDATAEEANRAFDLGARTVTHLFNAMRPLHHRDPGIAGAALARDDVIVQVIVDGLHLAPEIVRLIWRAAAGRVALVTDSTAVPDGRAPDGRLAGGTVTMIEAVRNLHELGVSLEEAVGGATTVPARVLGLEDVGRLAVGSPADVVVLSDTLEVERALVGGS